MDRSPSIEQQTLGSVTNLLGREAAVKLLALVGGIVVARRLAPSAFGIFAIATFAVGIFTLFSELGLGAALIRKADAVSGEELDALFTVQLVLVLILAAVLVLAAPVVAAAYHAPELTPVVRALALAFLLTSLRTTPTVAAERNLRYGPIAVADVAGQAAYWLLAIAGALAGLGVFSLVIALIGSSLLGTVVLYGITGFRPSLNFDWGTIRGNARFGALYQGQTLTGFVKDTISPSFGGLAYGGPAVGYLTWAQQLAVVPLLLTHHVARVSYPALARLRSDPPAFSRLANSAIAWTFRVTLPAFAVLVGLAPQIIQYVYGAKWLPAEPSLYVFCINMILGVGTGLLMPVLYSVGQAGTALRIAVAWTLGTFVLAIGMLALGVGFVGIAIAYAVGTALALAATITALRSIAPVDVIRPALLPLASAGVTAGILYLLAPRVVHNVWTLLVAAVAAGLGSMTVNVFRDRRAAWTFVLAMTTRRPALATGAGGDTRT